MEVELMRAVQERIIQDRDHFNMTYFRVFARDVPEWSKTPWAPKELYNTCGSVCCFGGTAVLIATGMHSTSGIEATRVLGLTGDQAFLLFYPDNWPDEFTQEARDDNGTLYYHLVTPEMTNRFVDAFIAADGDVSKF